MAETITTPGTPTGDASLRVDVAGTFATTGATSSLGDALEYRWTWDDGTLSAWLAAADGLSEAHTYSTSDTCHVSVQARCATHTTILSAASATKTVTIYHDEALAVAKITETVGPARTTETVAA